MRTKTARVSLPAISDDGRVAVLYELAQQAPPRVGFAVIGADDQAASGSIAPVDAGDAAAVADLRAKAQAFVSAGEWRPMVGAQRGTVDGEYDHLRWPALDLGVTVHQDGLQLWFTQTSTDQVLGERFSPATLVRRRGCDYAWTSYSVVLSDAAVDPHTGTAVVTLDVVPGAEAPAFACDLSTLVHVFKVAPPRRE